MWKTMILFAFMLFLLDISLGTDITAFVGDSKILQWTMDTKPPPTATVLVLHPLIINTKPVSLFSMFNMKVLLADSNQAKRVSNIGIMTGNIKFTLNNITEEDGGDYKTIFGGVDISDVTEKGLRLTVYVTPSKTTITEVSPPVVGKDMTLNCATQSNSKPDDHGLQMTYKWYRNSADLTTGGRYVISGSQLQVKTIQRTDTNTVFTCEAFETGTLISDVSAVYTVDVQYPPDPITMSPSSASYTLKENARLNAINCTSSCNPACTYSWERYGNQVSSGAVLKAINIINRDQAGQYVCKVKNMHGNIASSINVVVQYAPDKPVLRINGNNADVKESLPFTLTCTTQSVPAAKLTIHGSNMTEFHTLTSSFTIPNANCLDTGLFYCSAENIIGNAKSTGVNVNVLCKPRPDHRVTPILKQGLKSGETMNISGTLISNPQPTIYWSMRRNGSSVSRTLTSNQDNFVFKNHWNVPTITSQATRIAMKRDYFGEYLMHTHNAYGQYTMSFTIEHKQRPYEPELTSLVCKLDTSVEIKFRPNFDGGDKQSFSILMKSESDSVFKDFGDALPDNNKNEMTLRGPILESGASYDFRVTATNGYGTTLSTNHLKCTVEKEFNIGAEICVVVSGLLVIAIVTIAIFVIKRRRRTEKSDGIDPVNCSQLNSNEDEQEGGMKPNILYESAGPRYEPDPKTDKNGNAQKETAANAVYAEVVKPKNKKANNDVYAEVVKPKGKGKTNGKNGKGKKNKPVQQNGDVYENAPKIDASKEGPSRTTNNKGLVYIDVEFVGKDTNLKKTVIHGIQNKNEFADVDFTRRADPLPSDDDDDTMDDGTV